MRIGLHIDPLYTLVQRARGLRDELRRFDQEASALALVSELRGDSALAVDQATREARALALTLETTIAVLEHVAQSYAAAVEQANASQISNPLRTLDPDDLVWTQRQSHTSEVPITIYMSEEAGHELVEAAVETLVGQVALIVNRREDPVYGSYFRRMWATLAGSELAHEAAVGAAHAAEVRFVTAQDAAVTTALMQNLPPVLGALAQTKDAVVRVGALLIVKRDWVVLVYQLNAEQQLKLDHSPQLPMSPRDIAKTLSLEPVASPTVSDPR